MVHLPCAGHHQAPSGRGSPCGFDGGSWVERGSALGCWLTGRTEIRLDCPLSGETLQQKREHMHRQMFGVKLKFCLTWTCLWRKYIFTVGQRQKDLGTSHRLFVRSQAGNKSGSDRMKGRWGDSEGEVSDSPGQIVRDRRIKLRWR